MLGRASLRACGLVDLAVVGALSAASMAAFVGLLLPSIDLLLMIADKPSA